LEIVSYTPRAQSATAASASVSAPAPTNAKKRKSTDGDVTKVKRAKATTAEEPTNPAERWKWINLCKPEMYVALFFLLFFFPSSYCLFSSKLKGTKVEVFNCGGTFFKTTAKTLEMRLDKLQVFYNECQGDETRHSHYGYPELCKPKVKARKEDAETDRWSWINRCQPDMYVVPVVLVPSRNANLKKIFS
jgi:hypothetical protein